MLLRVNSFKVLNTVKDDLNQLKTNLFTAYFYEFDSVDSSINILIVHYTNIKKFGSTAIKNTHPYICIIYI